MINHENIIKCEGSYENPTKFYFVLELLDGGELLTQIEESHSNTYSEQIARRLFAQIVKGLGHLHSLKVIHRDLKPENVLFATKSIDSTLKLIDFGMAKKL